MGLGVAILALVATFGVGTLIGWFIHWMLHQRWSGRFYRSHMTHHLKLYPPKDLISDRYRDAGADNSSFVFTPGIAVVVLIFGLGLYLAGVSTAVLVAVGVVSAFIGAAHDLMHTAFHLRGTWLLRFGWFGRLRDLHFYHHINMKKNLGIVWFGWDRLLKTFRRRSAS